MADNKEVAMLFDSSHCTGWRVQAVEGAAGKS